jgi:hypothetical protein
MEEKPHLSESEAPTTESGGRKARPYRGGSLTSSVGAGFPACVAAATMAE